MAEFVGRFGRPHVEQMIAILESPLGPSGDDFAEDKTHSRPAVRFAIMLSSSDIQEAPRTRRSNLPGPGASSRRDGRFAIREQTAAGSPFTVRSTAELTV